MLNVAGVYAAAFIAGSNVADTMSAASAHSGALGPGLIPTDYLDDHRAVAYAGEANDGQFVIAQLDQNAYRVYA